MGEDRLAEAKQAWLAPWDGRRGVQSWDHNYASILVQADLDRTGAAAAARSGGRLIHDVLDREIVFGDCVFVYRLRGHSWSTLTESGFEADPTDEARDLSRALGTRAISWNISDTAGVLAYFLFDKGQEVERLELTEDDFVFESAEGRPGPENPEAAHRFAELRLVELDVFEPTLEASYFFGGHPQPGSKVRIGNPGLLAHFPGGERLTSVPAFERVDLIVAPPKTRPDGG